MSLATSATGAGRGARKDEGEQGLDAIVLWGWPTMWDFYTANARYLCPIGGNAEFNVLIFPLAGEPTCYRPDADLHRGLAQRAGLGRRHQRPRSGTWADSVAKRINELGARGSRNIGMDGLAGPLDPGRLAAAQRATSA